MADECSLNMQILEEANTPAGTNLSFIDHSTRKIAFLKDSTALTLQEKETVLKTVEHMLFDAQDVYHASGAPTFLMQVTVACTPLVEGRGYRLWEPKLEDATEDTNTDMVSSMEMKPQPDPDTDTDTDSESEPDSKKVKTEE